MHSKNELDSAFTIYSASAGSGKTSTLVKEYLKIVLDARHTKKFGQILAITFTNKAVNEMKSRILDSLHSFSRPASGENPTHLFNEICSELNLTDGELRARSGKVLKDILHNYAFFDISTIDKFTHRLIRTFARDLRLPHHFEVVLDTDLLLQEAVGRLIAKAGEDTRLTAVLIAFALEKTEDDRKWDIAYDLFKVGKLLFNENHLHHINQLAGKDLNAFGNLKKTLIDNIREYEGRMKALANEILASMASAHLIPDNFTRKWFPGFMSDFSRGSFDKINFNAGWKQKFDDHVPYNKTCDPAIKARIDRLLPAWRISFRELMNVFNSWAMLNNAYRNLVPLTILNAIRQELRALETERNQLPLASFNSLISNEIKNQPAPFIYERLGERFRHYFIDEFQDTSLMQWQNLIPLIANALESADMYGNPGTLFLVGDAKQAIYRWRGGRAEQFLHLSTGRSKPFSVEPTVALKSSNYRSNREIVHFNNEFFSHISGTIENEAYRQLYEQGSRQQAFHKEGGFVHLQFARKGEKPLDEQYCEAVLARIRELTTLHYNYSDICVLTRTRKQGVTIADYLIGHGIEIVSSETLLLNNSPRIQFLISILQFCQSPSNHNAAYSLLYFLAPPEAKHAVIGPNLHDAASFLLATYGFDLQYVRHATVYDGMEYAIGCFALAENSDAYLNFFLDEVLEVERSGGSSIPTFLEYWEQKKDKLSIASPAAANSVQVMTIHKAKGLEFPVVLYPFANTAIYPSRGNSGTYIWLPVAERDYSGFGELLLSKKKEMASYNATAEQLYEEEQQKLQLDAFNLLYVALTRAEKALFIFSETGPEGKGNAGDSNFSGLFINFLVKKGMWQDDSSTYSFGQLNPGNNLATPLDKALYPPYQYSFKNRPAFRIITRSGMLWDSARERALDRGLLLHDLMAHIETGEDLEPALEEMRRKGDLNEEAVDGLRAMALDILKEAGISRFYKKGVKVKNEAEIFTEDARILRPDRIVFENDKVTLIDYKTGNKSPAYAIQLAEYERTLEQMGYEVENKIIVYINQGIFLEFI